jgi:LPXTG-motif cell wall-anchored protein
MRHATLIILSSLLLVPLTTSGASSTPSIAAAAVESNASADLVRLVVSPAGASVQHKLICGEGMMRIRLNGVATRKEDPQSLLIPEGARFRHVRLVERNDHTSVVQIVPKNGLMSACGRTSVVALAGEIIISTAALESNEPEEKAAAPAETREQKASAGDNAPEKKAPAATTDQAEKEAATPASPASKAKLQLRGGDDKKTKPLFSEASSAPLDTPKIALIFGFAAMIAGAALYMRRRKKNPIEDMGRIEILSTKRLGLKQQLMLVSVQGTKFLLAVGEKSVSRLGTLQEANDALPTDDDEFALDDSLRAKESIDPVVESLLRGAPKEEMRPPLQKLRPETTRFDTELGRALDATAINPDSMDNPSSNAAGLVALARMRANLKKGVKETPRYEA